MVSLAETHMKLLFSADTEERELQGFTLVQLLLVRTFLRKSYLNTERACKMWVKYSASLDKFSIIGSFI